VSVPFVHSGFERRAGDEYPTIDARCVNALLESWDIPGPTWEPCAPNGSGIAAAWWTTMVYGADALTDAVPPGCRSAVTNPPYKTALCMAIVGRLRDLVDAGKLDVAALLLRSQWDHAVGRAELLDAPPFAGLVRLRFRPWWSESRDSAPIHSYQWVVFDRRHRGEPVTRYWPRSSAWRAA
jgi:hypothetical protein